MEAQHIQRMVEAIVFRERRIYDLVYFYGDTDCVLTTLAKIEETCEKHCPMCRIIRVNAEVFFREMINTVRNGAVLSPQCDCDLFIFEHIERIAGLQSFEQLLYGIFDWLLENGRQIIVTGSVPTAGIPRLAPRICAQLDGGVAFYLEPV